MATIPTSEVVYLLIKFGGECEDSYQCVLGATTNRIDANLHLAAFEEFYKQEIELRSIVDGFRNQYSELNPLPEFTPRIPTPKWRSGISEKEITPEMRAERDAIKEKNRVEDVKYERERFVWEQGEHAATINSPQPVSKKGYALDDMRKAIACFSNFKDKKQQNVAALGYVGRLWEVLKLLLQ